MLCYEGGDVNNLKYFAKVAALIEVPSSLHKHIYIHIYINVYINIHIYTIVFREGAKTNNFTADMTSLWCPTPLISVVCIYMYIDIYTYAQHYNTVHTMRLNTQNGSLHTK